MRLSRPEQTRQAGELPMIISIVVAAAENGVIGRDGWMPWRLSTDLKRFKALTTGRPVVMGRKTFEAIGKPLPGRRNIVVTRNRNWRFEGVETAASLKGALRLVGELGGSGDSEVFVAGGGEIYRQALPLADRIHFTHVLAIVQGDTIFPSLDPDEWTQVSSEDVPAGQRDTYPTRYVVYERRRRTQQAENSTVT
jgi:dihydrofolate reductase